MKKQSRRKPKKYPRLYSCTQQNAVSVSILAWGYCLTLINRFFNFSTRYTADLVATMIKQAEEADALPNKEQRSNPKRSAHVELVDANNAICLQWQKLKRYILLAYPKSLVNIKLDAAGYTHYNKAKSKRWEITLNMIKDAQQFMADFAAELEANNNMPKSFPAEFESLAQVFKTERNRFVSNSMSAVEGTDIKDKAIYEVEVELSNLLKAGKVIFDKEPLNLRKFTFEDLIKEVRGTEPAGVKGYLLAELNERPVEGVVVSTGEYSTTSDTNGRYELRLPSGVYTLRFEKPGYQTLVVEGRVVKVGVMGRYNATMMPEEPGEASEASEAASARMAAPQEDSAMGQPSA
jgi:Carboxypeptidase regulatory-like domain